MKMFLTIILSFGAGWAFTNYTMFDSKTCVKAQNSCLGKGMALTSISRYGIGGKIKIKCSHKMRRIGNGKSEPR